MKVTPYQQATGHVLKNRIDGLAAAVLAKDNSVADLAPAKDKVTLHTESGTGVILPAQNSYLEEVVSGTVEPKAANLTTIQYYNTSYGRSAESLYELGKESLPDGGSLLRERYYDPMGVRNHKREIRLDGNGEVVGFKEKRFAATWGEAVREVATSPAAWVLIAGAGLLMGCPGTLGYALAGSAAPGVIAAGATAAGLAYYKTRPWE